MKNDNIIALDTNIFIYHFDKNLAYLNITQKLFGDLEKDKFSAVTSIISLTELLSYKMSDAKVTALKSEFLHTPNLRIYEVSQDVAIEAASLRRKYHFRLPEAIHIATAIHGKADIFITNDDRLKICKEIKIKTLVGSFS